MEAERSTKGQGQGHEIVIDCNSAANGPIFKYTDQIVQISPADMPAVFRLHGRYFLFHFCSHLYTLNQIARAAVYEFSKIYGKLYLLSSYLLPFFAFIGITHTDAYCPHVTLMMHYALYRACCRQTASLLT